MVLSGLLQIQIYFGDVVVISTCTSKKKTIHQVGVIFSHSGWWNFSIFFLALSPGVCCQAHLILKL